MTTDPTFHHIQCEKCKNRTLKIDIKKNEKAGLYLYITCARCSHQVKLETYLPA